MAKPGNIIDTMDATCDEYLSCGGSIQGWHSLPDDLKVKMEAMLVRSTISLGYWFRWSDGTVRDWPEEGNTPRDRHRTQGYKTRRE
jgi:hypothetical protein